MPDASAKFFICDVNKAKHGQAYDGMGISNNWLFLWYYTGAKHGQADDSKSMVTIIDIDTHNKGPP